MRKKVKPAPLKRPGDGVSRRWRDPALFRFRSTEPLAGLGRLCGDDQLTRLPASLRFGGDRALKARSHYLLAAAKEVGVAAL